MKDWVIEEKEKKTNKDPPALRWFVDILTGEKHWIAAEGFWAGVLPQD